MQHLSDYKMFNKDNKLFAFYKLLPPKLRTNFKYEFSKILDISPTYFYIKITQNNFEAHERALLSYHLGIPQKVLFPSFIEKFQVSEDYKSANLPFFTYFFDNHSFQYDPSYINQILYSELLPEILKIKA